MAYTKYYFSQASISDNANDVKNWLAENATEYFDSFNIHSGSFDSAVICGVGSTAKLYFQTTMPNNSTYNSLIITLDSGLNIKFQSSDGGAYKFTYVKYAIKSDNGIMLYMDENHSIIITKSNAGTTAVYAKWKTNSSSNMVADLINSETISTQNFSSKVESNEITALAPLCFPSGIYAQKLFMTPYSQYVGYIGIIDINGTKYAYDGYAALEL